MNGLAYILEVCWGANRGVTGMTFNIEGLSQTERVSPLYADLSGLPPIRVHVGDDEVLLDDSRRYVERAVTAGVDAKLDVWMGMPHGFVKDIGRFNAATQALNAIGVFLIERLERTGR